MNSHRLRLLMLAVVITGGFLVLFYRLWFLQIENQEEYIKRQPVTGVVKQRIPGVRGRILDKSGIELARNETNMEVALDLAAVEAAWWERERAKPRKERRSIPVFTHGPRKEEVTDIIAVLNEIVFPELDRLNLYRRPVSEAEREKQKRAIILSYISNKGVIPYVYEKNLLQSDLADFRRFTAYAENTAAIPGLTISERPKRRYPFKAFAGHLVGYLRENRDVLPPEEKKAMDQDWEKNKVRWHIEADDLGVAGLELSMDEKLRPKPGERVWLKNEHGRLAEEIESMRREPLPGADVYLTIDARLQMIAEMALRDAKVGRGAVVIMDPSNGQVRAMASVPSYDPSIFIPPQDPQAITATYEDLSGPIFCYALRAVAPGSTMKLLTALAGSAAGKGSKSYSCAGSASFGGRPIACWIQKKGGAHNTIGLQEAIKVSCNCFFMKMGVDAGPNSLREIGGLFGFGDPGDAGHSGIEVPAGEENNGSIGSEKWWEARRGTPWRQSETAYISMGQGQCAATPLQICMLAAAIGNGGKVYRPTLIDHVEEFQYDRDGVRQRVIGEFQPQLAADLLTMGVKPKDFENMREGMRRVVNDKGGTGARARSELVVIAGKTGTAQRPGAGPLAGKPDNLAWFMSFAPYDNPTLAVVVLVANGEAGGAVAAPVAKRIIERSLGVMNGTYSITPQPLEPAKGHFDHLMEVVYEGENVPPAETEPQDEDSTSVDEDPEAAPPAVPVVKAEPPREPVIEEDDSHTLTSQPLQPVKFRLKTDPPNPPYRPRTASAH